MSVPTITNPIGIDLAIANVQSFLSTYLWVSPLEYEAYARAYVIDGIPRVFKGGIDYEELLLNDKVDAHSFFILTDGERENLAVGEYKANVDIFFFVNLKTCYSSIAHRADENAIRDIWTLLSPGTKGYTIESIITGANVFSGLEGFEAKHDMQKFCVIRFKGNLEYFYINTGC